MLLYLYGYVVGLVLDCGISSALALEIPQSGTKPLMFEDILISTSDLQTGRLPLCFMFS